MTDELREKAKAFDVPITFTLSSRSALDKSKSGIYLIRGFRDEDFTLLAFWDSNKQEWFDSQMASLSGLIYECHIYYIGHPTYAYE